MAYADTTKVPIGRTRDAIEALVLKHGGTTFGVLSGEAQAQIVFEAHGRRLLFRLPLTHDPARRMTALQVEQFRRSRWRGLYLTIKAKFESFESGIETFEDAFLANVVLPGGSTVGDQVPGEIERMLSQNKLLPLLAPPPT